MHRRRSPGALSAKGLALVFSLLQAGCSDPTGPPGIAAFAVVVSGERFIVRVETDEQVQALEARLASGQQGVLSGELRRGSGGYNQPWRWHLEPSTVHVPDLAMELCDGRPSLIEADLGYWLETVQRFCPWGAKVTERVE